MKPIFAVLLLCCVFTKISAQSSLIADGAKLTKGAGEYAFLCSLRVSRVRLLTAKQGDSEVLRR